MNTVFIAMILLVSEPNITQDSFMDHLIGTDGGGIPLQVGIEIIARMEKRTELYGFANYCTQFEGGGYLSEQSNRVNRYIGFLKSNINVNVNDNSNIKFVRYYPKALEILWVKPIVYHDIGGVYGKYGCNVNTACVAFKRTTSFVWIFDPNFRNVDGGIEVLSLREFGSRFGDGYIVLID